MLKMRHKIIPIIFRDISHIKIMDQNLKFLLETITYLEWPGIENSKKEEKFWERLKLSLPKLKSIEKLESSRASMKASITSTSHVDISSEDNLLVISTKIS